MKRNGANKDPEQLPPFADDSNDILNAIVETPKNSRRKYKFDETTGLFKLVSVMPEGFNFPFDFGFIPSTLAQDGDPLDVMVLADL